MNRNKEERYAKILNKLKEDDKLREEKQAIMRQEKKRVNKIRLTQDLITIVNKIKKENYKNDTYIYLDYFLLKEARFFNSDRIITMINETHDIIVESIDLLFELESRDLEEYTTEKLASHIKKEIDYYRDAEPKYKEIAKLYVNMYINLNEIIERITTQAGIVREEEIFLSNTIEREIENVRNILYESEMFFYKKMKDNIL